uniref:Uncharacterized protein n=1 Tax=Anguilla anguilla TaxID=7936 RepID=A0A0E9QIT1_ANGAN
MRSGWAEFGFVGFGV